MKISSKCNVEKEILFFWRKKSSFCENFGIQIKFCAIKYLRNIWMIPCQLKLSSFLHQGSHGLLCTWLWHSYQLKQISNFCQKILIFFFSKFFINNSYLSDLAYSNAEPRLRPFLPNNWKWKISISKNVLSKYGN